MQQIWFGAKFPEIHSDAREWKSCPSPLSTEVKVAGAQALVAGESYRFYMYGDIQTGIKKVAEELLPEYGPVESWSTGQSALGIRSVLTMFAESTPSLLRANAFIYKVANSRYNVGRAIVVSMSSAR